MVSLTSWLYAPGPAKDTRKGPSPSPHSAPAITPSSGRLPEGLPAPHLHRHQSSSHEEDPARCDHGRPAPTPILSLRSMKQFGFFLGGAGFMLFSIAAARRAVARQRALYRPQFFQPSSWAPLPKDKRPAREPMVAVEALQLATLNVASFAIMMTGGVCFALDVSSVDDLRAIARRNLGGVGTQLDEAAEREVAEWVAKTMGIEIEKLKK